MDYVVKINLMCGCVCLRVMILMRARLMLLRCRMLVKPFCWLFSDLVGGCSRNSLTKEEQAHKSICSRNLAKSVGVSELQNEFAIQKPKVTKSATSIRTCVHPYLTIQQYAMKEDWIFPNMEPIQHRNNEEEDCILRVESTDSMPTNLDLDGILVYEEFTYEEGRNSTHNTSRNERSDAKANISNNYKRAACTMYTKNLVFFFFLFASIYLMIQIKFMTKHSIKELEMMRSDVGHLKQLLSLEHEERKNVDKELWKRGVFLLSILISSELHHAGRRVIETNNSTILDMLPERFRSGSNSSFNIKVMKTKVLNGLQQMNHVHLLLGSDLRGFLVERFPKAVKAFEIEMKAMLQQLCIFITRLQKRFKMEQRLRDVKGHFARLKKNIAQILSYKIDELRATASTRQEAQDFLYFMPMV